MGKLRHGVKGISSSYPPIQWQRQDLDPGGSLGCEMVLSSYFYFTTVFLLATAPLGDNFSYLYNRGHGVRLHDVLNSVKTNVSDSC